MRRRAPVSTPGGIVTDRDFVTVTLPCPPHSWQGERMMEPVPPHRGQGWAIWKMPLDTSLLPVPRQSGQVVLLVPGAAPLPPHAGHESRRDTEMVFSVPRYASSRVTETAASRSLPFAPSEEEPLFFFRLPRVPKRSNPESPKRFSKKLPLRPSSPSKTLRKSVPLKMSSRAKFLSTPSWPYWSYRARFFGSESTPYASEISLKVSSAFFFLSADTRSGWWRSASSR